METTPRASRPFVAHLTALLASRKDLTDALEDSIRRAAVPDVANVPAFLDFLNNMAVLIPTDRHLNRFLYKFHYLIGRPAGGLLGADAGFQDWSRRFAEDLGSFLDTPQSAPGVQGALSDPRYRAAEYSAPPSGYLTYNQFFARHTRPGKRPVDGPGADGIVVSPADGVYGGQWPVTGESRVTAKGLTWPLADLLSGSPYAGRFRDGVFTQILLDVCDYHRFHVPVGGVIKEARKIRGRVAMDAIKNPDGSFDAVEGTGFQMVQERALVVIDSPLGLVAVLPIGMAQVSSVNLTAEEGSRLVKGEELGYFAFGGSDVVMIFEAGKVRLDASAGTHYDQGREVGHGKRNAGPRLEEKKANLRKRRAMD